MGLANHYRKFVWHFSTLAAPPESAQGGSHVRAGAARMGGTLRARRACSPTPRSSLYLRSSSSPTCWRVPSSGIQIAQLTQPKRSYPSHLLELSVVYTLKTLRPLLLDKPFKLHPDNASLQWLQQQQHVTPKRACRVP